MKFSNRTTLLTLIILAFCTLSVTVTGAKSSATGLEWEVLQQWDLPETPLDIVHSLDGKYVFILTADSKVQIYSSQGNLEGAVDVDKGVTGIDIAPRAEMLYLIDGKNKTFSALSINFVREINTSGSPFQGPENAPVTVVVFTDFECPYCKKVEPLLAEIHENNTETVKIVFKNMPLQFHKFADPAHRAAIAAGNQGKFWEFHDALFASEKLSNEIIEGIAAKLELDLEQWKKDMQSDEVRKRIMIDIQDAQKAGVTGTPTIFVNGRLLKNRSLQGFQEMINEELKAN